MSTASTTAPLAYRNWRHRGATLQPTQPLFGEFAEAWYQRQRVLAEGGLLRPSSARRFHSALGAHLLPFFAALPLDEVTRERCDAYRMLALNVGRLTPASINSIMEVMHLVLRDAQRRGLLPTDPLNGMHPLRVARRLVEPYDQDELDRLIKKTRPEARVVVALAAFAGLRQGEIFALRVRDLDLDGRVLEVSRSLQQARDGLSLEHRLGPTKTPASARHVPVQRRLHEIAQIHVNRFIEPNDHELLCSRRGRPWEPSHFHRRVWRPAQVAAELRPLHFHDLRRSFIAQCVAVGIPPTQTAAWLGHATSRMTDYYFTSGRRQREGALALLDTATP